MRSRPEARRAPAVAAIALVATALTLAACSSPAASPAPGSSSGAPPLSSSSSSSSPPATSSSATPALVSPSPTLPSTSPAPSSTSPNPASPPSARPGPEAISPAKLIPLPHGVGVFHQAPVPFLIHGPRNLPVPVLMYHVLAPPPAGAAYPELFVAPAAFAQQMRYLVAQGYHAVTLQQVTDFWAGRSSLPTKPIVLSFDDGYNSDWRVAAPILQRIGWPAVLDLCLSAMKPRGDLTGAHVRLLVGAGWEIADHSITHKDLTTLDAAGLHRDVVVSRVMLRRLTGQPIDVYCYPSGAYDAKVVAAVKAAGFAAATTTDPGYARPSHPFRLARIRVSGGMGLTEFVKALKGQ